MSSTSTAMGWGGGVRASRARGGGVRASRAQGGGVRAGAGLVPYDEAVSEYEPLIGLETHVELGTVTKLFCGCPAAFGGEPNTHTCPVCLGLPGSLPVPSRTAIEYTIRIGLALNCSIAEWCRFARKNYFYPDMPKNFQISQYDEPLCTDGWLDVTLDEGEGAGRTFRVGIERVHLEEDTGKSQHVGGATGRIHGADYSLVDYNRAGIPLVEIVTKPVEGTGTLAPVVAHAYVAELRDLLRTLGVSDVRMEEGSLRCDVNTSLSPRGSGRWGTRTETKNVNSLRSVERSVHYEIERQAAVLDAGERVIQETRHFHEDSGITTSGRSKEEAQDYRYFPEPDLVPLAPARDWVEQIRATLPELPSARRARLQARVGHLRGRDDEHPQRGRDRPCRADGRRRGVARRRGQVVAQRTGPAGQRLRHRAHQPADHPCRRGQGGRAGRVRGAQRPARPAGHRRRAGRRGNSRRGGGGARPGRGQRRGLRWAPPWTRRSPRTPTWPTRSAAARSPRPVPSSARS